MKLDVSSEAASRPKQSVDSLLYCTRDLTSQNAMLDPHIVAASAAADVAANGIAALPEPLAATAATATATQGAAPWLRGAAHPAYGVTNFNN